MMNEEEEYNNFFVTSDTHFNHDKEFVYKTRGYNSSSLMTDDIIDKINTVVGEEGTLLHLGDFCLNTSEEEYLLILKKLKIKKLLLLWGNHNNPIKKNNLDQVCCLYNNIFIKYLGFYYKFKVRKKLFVCCHFPIISWEGMYRGSIHLTGHTHGKLDLTLPSNKQQKVLDCGWDVFGRPISLKEIEEIMSTKLIPSL